MRKAKKELCFLSFFFFFCLFVLENNGGVTAEIACNEYLAGELVLGHFLSWLNVVCLLRGLQQAWKIAFSSVK